MLNAEDHLAILDLYARYTHAVDSGDAETWCACFTGDGFLSVPVSATHVQGPDQLRAFAVDYHKNSGGSKKHVTTNIWLQPRGDEVTGAAYLMMLVAGPPATGSTVGVSGRYDDRLVKVDGRWLFAQRVLHLDVSGQPG